MICTPSTRPDLKEREHCWQTTHTKIRTSLWKLWFKEELLMSLNTAFFPVQFANNKKFTNRELSSKMFTEISQITMLRTKCLQQNVWFVTVKRFCPVYGGDWKVRNIKPLQTSECVTNHAKAFQTKLLNINWISIVILKYRRLAGLFSTSDYFYKIVGGTFSSAS